MTELELVKRHVAEGKARIARQIQLITDLRERGTRFWVLQAVDMLETMGQRQRIAVEHLRRLEQERNAAPDEVALSENAGVSYLADTLTV